MKKLFLFAFASMMCAGAYASASGSDDDIDRDGDDEGSRPKLTEIETIQSIELVNCNDVELDWSLFDEKTRKAMVTKKGLELESKKDKVYCASYCELDNFNPDTEDFIARFLMSPNDVSDDKPFGIIYDVKNENNYRMILVYKKNFRLATVTKGEIEMEKSKFYKPGKNKKKMEIDLVREKGKFYVFLNGLELLKTKSPKLEHPTFGFFVAPKCKMLCERFGFKKYAASDNEESDD